MKSAAFSDPAKKLPRTVPVYSMNTNDFPFSASLARELGNPLK